MTLRFRISTLLLFTAVVCAAFAWFGGRYRAMQQYQRQNTFAQALASENFKQLERMLEESPRLLNEPNGHLPLGSAPLHWACSQGRPELVRFLLAKGADPSRENFSSPAPLPLHAAATNSESEYVRIAMVRALAAHDTDLNAKGRFGESALYYSIILRYSEAPIALLEHGADPNIKADRSGQTPLHQACEFRSRELIEQLLAHSADPTIRDHEGRLPEDMLWEREGDWNKPEELQVLLRAASVDSGECDRSAEAAQESP